MLGRVNDDLLTIGQFARLARLSVKQLRNYAELGLLEPAWIDPDSGYRYYRATQARAALAIGLLRSLDVPLAVIATVIGPMADTGEAPDPGSMEQATGTCSRQPGDSGGTGRRTGTRAGVEGAGVGDRRAVAALARVRDDLEAELARRRRTLHTLERILESGLPAPQVSVVTEPPRRVALLRDVAATPEDIGRVTSACVARLLAILAGVSSRGASSWAPSWAPTSPGVPGDAGPVQLVGLFPVDFGDSIPIAVAVVMPGNGDCEETMRTPEAEGVAVSGVTGGSSGRTGTGTTERDAPGTWAETWNDAPPGTWVDILPGGTFASATHVGPYDQISLTAHALLAWCAERGHLPAGPMREIYVSDPSSTPPERLVTHLMIPLEDMS
ncbi:GyrI-like domain-containing protein [Microtetraspora sp. NBRC 16547]|uniref:MerR family transcriptional regulator n=1 Tax=Microtetraspora sp. NBRC 16547 TaxID=3030993 RepID=UPI0024A01098|nr:GyrI-like domain-containing protein [Microtetraspora sp. NBRC 16547]GLX00029.1 hypothetical protein Misp02_41150 [Microtetraspora sp. NBRC 16547]